MEAGAMWFEAVGRVGELAVDPATLGTALLGSLLAMARQRRRAARERRQARRLEAELMAYMLLDDWHAGDAEAMGRRICRAVSRHSAFGCAALLVRDGSTGRMCVRASKRSDDLTVRALDRWAEAEEGREMARRARVRRESVAADQGGEAAGAEGLRVQLVRLERRAGYHAGDPAALAWCSALIVPMCNQRGQVTGALAVCADRFQHRPEEEMLEAVRPLEALAARFGEGLEELAR